MRLPLQELEPRPHCCRRVARPPGGLWPQTLPAALSLERRRSSGLEGFLQALQGTAGRPYPHRPFTGCSWAGSSPLVKQRLYSQPPSQDALKASSAGVVTS